MGNNVYFDPVNAVESIRATLGTVHVSGEQNIYAMAVVFKKLEDLKNALSVPPKNQEEI